jgi:Peptidase propeptide and YPEB domain
MRCSYHNEGNSMRWMLSTLAVAAALTIFSAAPSAQIVGKVGGCEPGDKIDASTAAQARKKIEAAGYRKVGDLKKGCDNSWHGTAEKDGSRIHVVLNPQGLVLPEGD